MKTLAAVSRPGTHAPALESVELDNPRDDELLVRIVATGICHTDISVHEGRAPGPMVLGHEGAGIVERAGAAVEGIKPGDHVVMSYSFCGHCPSCTHGHPSYCYDVMKNFSGTRGDGTSPITQNGKPLYANFFGQSSFAQYAIVHKSSAVKVTKDVPLENLGPLGCGIITGAGSVINAFKLRPGESLAVFGTGSVGLSAVMAAKLSGASRIIAVDVVPSRLALAKELGATDTVDARSGDPVAAIRELLPYGVNYSFNTTRLEPVAIQAIDCLAMRGIAGYVAGPPEWSLPFDKLFSFGRRIQPILMGDAVTAAFVPMLIDLNSRGKFPFDRLIKFYKFEEIAQAFEDSHSGVTIKPILRMSH